MVRGEIMARSWRGRGVIVADAGTPWDSITLPPHVTRRQCTIPFRPHRNDRHALGHSIHHRQRSGRALLVLRHEDHSCRLHGAVPDDFGGHAQLLHRLRGARMGGVVCCQRVLLSRDRRVHRRRVSWQVPHHHAALDGVLPRPRGVGVHRSSARDPASDLRAEELAHRGTVPRGRWLGRHQAVRLGPCRRSIRPSQQASPHPSLWLVLFLDQLRLVLLDASDALAPEEVWPGHSLRTSWHLDGAGHAGVLARTQSLHPHPRQGLGLRARNLLEGRAARDRWSGFDLCLCGCLLGALRSNRQRVGLAGGANELRLRWHRLA